MKNLSRRNFFRSFVGEAITQYDIINGRPHIALNKLHKWPDEIIKQITPVFFKDEHWLIKDAALLKPRKKDLGFYVVRKLSVQENFIIEHFDKEISLLQISEEFSNKFKIASDKAYKTVCKFFFEMAILRVCHPSKAYLNE